MRKTSKKKYRASLLRCKEWIKANRILPTDVFMKTIISKIQGHCRYYGVTDNRRSVRNFIDECRSLIFKWLNRRSQKRSFDWNKFFLFLKKYPLPKVKTYVHIFDLGAGSNYLCKWWSEEPYALIGHVRFCEGLESRGSVYSTLR